ncbi:hypothetical protein QQS21_007003 [Conoideocrella luteorostrata]|uniref:Uncharacterized protein n=1 Tax=Conoideocrella luteorostrata TaxID=1105319 RepID=A0AAJ0FXT2_9HYPO|nr:hypothetical protein QQS21_007003 [Conoideocrella luteorostrata]
MAVVKEDRKKHEQDHDQKSSTLRYLAQEFPTAKLEDKPNTMKQQRGLTGHQSQKYQIVKFVVVSCWGSIPTNVRKHLTTEFIQSFLRFDGSRNIPSNNRIMKGMTLSDIPKSSALAVLAIASWGRQSLKRSSIFQLIVHKSRWLQELPTPANPPVKSGRQHSIPKDKVDSQCVRKNAVEAQLRGQGVNTATSPHQSSDPRLLLNAFAPLDQVDSECLDVFIPAAQTLRSKPELEPLSDSDDDPTSLKVEDDKMSMQDIEQKVAEQDHHTIDDAQRKIDELRDRMSTFQKMLEEIRDAFYDTNAMLQLIKAEENSHGK